MSLFSHTTVDLMDMLISCPLVGNSECQIRNSVLYAYIMSLRLDVLWMASFVPRVVVGTNNL